MVRHWNIGNIILKKKIASMNKLIGFGTNTLTFYVLDERSNKKGDSVKER